MCVILHALAKKHIKREEVEESMKNNSSGFFLAELLKNGKRKTLRTLDKNEALQFFDKAKDTNPFVLHARIPSRGETTLDNVHGWEEDGIIFCHNMTISSLDGMMKELNWKKTDSEFFFRKVFIPYYRGCGKSAYKDGKFCPELTAFVNHYVGTSNKFLFIMPDNNVLRFGNWLTEDDRKEGDEVAFYASNATYKVVKPVITHYFSSQDYDSYENYYGGGYNSGYTFRKELEDLIPDYEILRLALFDYMSMEWILTMTNCHAEDADLEMMDWLDTNLQDSRPQAFTQVTYAAVLKVIGELHDKPDKAHEIIKNFIHTYALELQRSMQQGSKFGYTYEPLEDCLTTLKTELKAFSKMTNMYVDFTKDTKDYLCGFKAAKITVDDSGEFKLSEYYGDEIITEDNEGTPGGVNPHVAGADMLYREQLMLAEIAGGDKDTPVAV